MPWLLGVEHSECKKSLCLRNIFVLCSISHGVALSLAQARHSLLRWHHIKAHAGQPDNEAADSIAYAVVLGWQPPCCPPFRLRDLFEHPLRDWAWMEYRPTDELPNLATVLSTRPQPPMDDTTMWMPTESCVKAKVDHISWKIGTANVRTMEYHKAQYTDKLPLLRSQLQDQAFDIFAFQECRGRQSQCVDDAFSSVYVLQVCMVKVVSNYGCAIRCFRANWVWPTFDRSVGCVACVIYPFLV